MFDSFWNAFAATAGVLFALGVVIILAIGTLALIGFIKNWHDKRTAKRISTFLDGKEKE